MEKTISCIPFRRNAFIKIIFCFITTFLFSACTEKCVSEPELIRLSATAGNLTKVGFGESGDFYWTAEDKIGVMLEAGSNIFSSMSLTEGAGEKTGNFACTGNGKVQSYAVYPYSGQHRLDGSELTYHIDGEMMIDSFDKSKFDGLAKDRHSTCAPMWGAVKNGYAQFYHLGGVFYVELPVLPAGDQFTIEVIADQRLSGDFKVDLSTAEPSTLENMPVIKTDDSPYGKVLVRTVKNTNHLTQGVFYFPVPTGKFTNVKLVVKDAKGKIFSHRIYKSVTVARHNLVLLPGADKFEFDKGQIKLTDKEFRGVWLTTAWSLDWPQTKGEENRKNELIAYFELFESMNINNVFFQIRSMADAFYDSKYESWSSIFGGNPGWEPIQVAIEEAHKRGMQLHLWMNPYRIKNVDKDGKYPQWDPKIDGSLVKDYPKTRMYNPALPEVRERIAAIVDEALTRYPEADGLHFDDYFYPSLEFLEKEADGQYNYLDKEEFALYGSAFSTIEEFRFHNVNEMVRMVKSTIEKVGEKMGKNYLFTIAPSGDMEYNRLRMFADVKKWCKERWIDALIPQLYWNREYFDPRIKDCVGIAGDLPVFVGYDINNLLLKNPQLFQEEYYYAHTFKEVQGGSFYRAIALKPGTQIHDKVKEVYSQYRLSPYLGPAGHQKPATPTDIKVSETNLLTWKGEGMQYAIYKDRSAGLDRGKAADLLGVVRGNNLSYQLPGPGTYYITALDRYNAESEVSDMIYIPSPDLPDTGNGSTLENGNIKYAD